MKDLLFSASMAYSENLAKALAAVNSSAFAFNPSRNSRGCLVLIPKFARSLTASIESGKPTIRPPSPIPKTFVACREKTSNLA